MHRRLPGRGDQLRVVDASLIRVSRRAMACEFEVCFPAGRQENGTELAIESLDLVESLEERLSFFRPESDIGRINRLAAEAPVEVEPALFDLLQLAVRLSGETGGAYDVTSAPLWEVWGFARRAGEIPSDAELAVARARIGSQFVELNPAERTIRFRKAGVKINLGSIGKGYALDVCAERLLVSGMTDFLLHGGQSSVLARGSPAGDASGDSAVGGVSRRRLQADTDDRRQESPPTVRPWEVGLANPQQPGRRLAIVNLRDRALGTSGGQFQSFRHQGRRYSHILDPRTGWPAEEVLSVTVLAPTAALADALSTAFFVLGPQASLDYCGAHPKIGMIMLCPGAGGKLEIHVAGVNEGEITRCDTS
jgi:FAD:protein FMN transferase